MSGTLYLVATPIGNLEDITLRAVRILWEVRLIAAEEHPPHRQAPTLRHHHHDHQSARAQRATKDPTLVARLLVGDSIALLSDAGTPIVSDPGLLLVRQSLDAMNGFTFVGFPPRRLNDRK